MLGMDYLLVFSRSLGVSAVYDSPFRKEGPRFTCPGSDSALSLASLRCGLRQSNDIDLVWAPVKWVG